MDDILVLAPTRHKLRQAVRVVNQTLTALGLEKAPNKTFIGRVEKGFDFLGYHVSPQGLTVAAQTWMNYLKHRRRLYERVPRCLAASRRGAYVQRWLAWIRGGVRELLTVGVRAPSVLIDS
jgi:RNA-directed DNA polymerase